MKMFAKDYDIHALEGTLAFSVQCVNFRAAIVGQPNRKLIRSWPDKPLNYV
jgi:hypothetical protein